MDQRRIRILLNIVGLVFVSIALLLQWLQGTVSVYSWGSLIIALIAMLAARYMRAQMMKKE